MLCKDCYKSFGGKCVVHWIPNTLEEERAEALANMTWEKAIERVKIAGKICGDNDFIPAEIQMNLVAEWMEKQQNQIEFYRAGVQGAIIGSLAGGHMDGPDGGEWSKHVLAEIADMMGLEIPEAIKKANGLY